jgi:hypothetical protein
MPFRLRGVAVGKGGEMGAQARVIRGFGAGDELSHLGPVEYGASCLLRRDAPVQAQNGRGSDGK